MRTIASWASWKVCASLSLGLLCLVLAPHFQAVCRLFFNLFVPIVERCVPLPFSALSTCANTRLHLLAFSFRAKNRAATILSGDIDDSKGNRGV